MINALACVAGASIFVAIEGAHEQQQQTNIREERYVLVRQLRELTRDPVLANDDAAWEGRAIQEMHKFEEVLIKSLDEGITPKETDDWTFWNAPSDISWRMSQPKFGNDATKPEKLDLFQSLPFECICRLALDLQSARFV
ncbi:hypothetical protein C0J52_00095 [Blattella germanica]|nr:hypothetical protein C0J52_00095 [Blattella germanica]